MLWKISRAICAVAIVCCPAAAEDDILLFGGLSYVDDVTTPAMAAMLAGDAQDQALKHGDAVIEYTAGLVDQQNLSGGLPNISDHKIVQTEEEAWAIATELGASRGAGQLISALQLYGDNVYGLMFLANYEDVIVQTLSYSDSATGERKSAKKRTYIVGVSALTLELDPNSNYRRILLSSSDLGRRELSLPAEVEPTEAQKTSAYRQAYQKAISGSLSKLRKAGDLDTSQGRGALNHMVTGFAMMENAPIGLLNYDLASKPSAADLQANMCTVPDGCTTIICRKRAAMLMHGFTSSLSEAGLPVLPPITAEYTGDLVAGIELKLGLFGDEARLLGDTQSILLDPADAATKWIVVWRGSEMKDSPNEAYPDIITDRRFYSQIGYVRAGTGFDGCTDVYDLQRDPPPDSTGNVEVDSNSLGCSVENFVNSQGEPGRGVERDHYTLAALDHVNKIGAKLRHERSSDSFTCKPFAGAD
jgi:hypothetical protein|tara:strand:+ start:1069 stop:2490 length:1422 start_codon:yes stop_codon:yes gene_type:complete